VVVVEMVVAMVRLGWNWAWWTFKVQQGMCYTRFCSLSVQTLALVAQILAAKAPANC
jgi:hypothetical protein